MLRRFSLLFVLFTSMNGLLHAQLSNQDEHLQELTDWQHHYKRELNADARSPVHGSDTGLIRFFPISMKWRTSAKVKLTPDAKPFKMGTHSGKTKEFRSYAILEFTVAGQGKRKYALHVYEPVNRPADGSIPDDYLFLPFQDLTSNKTSYGGGRYIDVSRASLGEGFYVLDFNKAYNPYCAFGGNYSCPIPPDENRLNVAVDAGEALPQAPLGAID